MAAMSDHTITRAHLAEAVFQEVGLSRNDSAALVDEVLEEIGRMLTRGEMVKLSSFGSFQVRSKNERIGRNPKTGEEVPILPRKVLIFRASQGLKQAINDGLSGQDETAAEQHS
jgi:integration host factor subunit alpha